MDLTYFKRMEAQSRRKGVMHPDQCPKLRLQGVDFAIPPRGVRIVPQFDAEGKATLAVEGVDEWQEIPELLERVAEGLDGQQLEADAQLVADLMALARKALLVQYELTDAQIASLLAYQTDMPPEWIPRMIHWAHGLPMDAMSLAAEMDLGDLFDPIELDPEEAEPGEPEVPAPRRPWWKFW